MKKLTSLLIILLSSTLVVGEPQAAESKKIPAEYFEFFETDVRPLLAAHCYQCHGAKKQ